MKKFLLLLIIVASSCQGNDDVYCTQEVVFGLTVTVKDAVTEAGLQEGVLVIATDGSYTEILQYAMNNAAVFIGAAERPGNYTLTVSKEGYQTFTTDVIVVTRDMCHVISQSVTVTLQPE